MTLLLLLFAGVVGFLIGIAGVGGVLLAPGLVASGVMDPHIAAATSTWAFLFTGAVGTAAYAWSGRVEWAMLWPLSIGIIPFAFLGARTNAILPASAVLVAMAALTLLVGINQLLRRHRLLSDDGRRLGAAALVAVGAAVGFGSALTGTGGPVLLVPVLLMLGVGPVKSVGLSQAAQLPIVASGSIGYLQTGATNLSVGTALGLTAAIGTVFGAIIATRLDARRLRDIVAIACIVTGAALTQRMVGVLA